MEREEEFGREIDGDGRADETDGELRRAEGRATVEREESVRLWDLPDEELEDRSDPDRTVPRVVEG